MKTVVMVAWIPLLFCGCTTFTNYGRAREMQEAAEKQRLHAEFRRLDGRLQGVEMENADLRREIQALRAEITRVAAEHRVVLDERLREMDGRMQEAERVRGTDREAILGAVSKEVTTLVNSLRQGDTVAMTEDGYVHVIKQGQTLSEIAEAYKVTVALIVRANHLKDPHAIRMGQKLFIPKGTGR